MATYDRLLVSTGGGILNDSKKSDRQEDATICIGLGGTGKDALKKLKKEVYKRLKPDDPKSSVPTYRNIKFLLVDSDAAGLDSHELTSIDKTTEYFSISNNNIIDTFNSKSIIASRQELSWLNHEHITIKDAGNGAGGIRQVGRFLLIDKSGLFKAKLTTMIHDAIQGVSGDLNIHIFSGISGGTGSGTFLDVCYIVRHVLETLGRTNDRISGYFFLPDVNLSVPAVMSNPLTSSYVRCNGYAALKELDYLMSLEESHGRFIQNYGSFEVNTTRPPVDLCYLISTTNADGVSMPDGYEYGLSVAVDYVIAFLSKITLPEGATDPSGSMTLQGHISNLESAKAQIKKVHGASVEYNIIGAANAEMPLSDITTYLGAKLFERFDIFDKTPTEKDLTDFVASNQMTFEQLLQTLTKGISYKVPYPPSLTKANDVIAGDKRAISCADKWTGDVKGILEENRKSMTEALKDYDRIPEGSTSVISRIFSSLYLNYSMNSKTGPFFAMKLLGGQNNKNLLHIIDGYIANNENLLKAELRQDPLRSDELAAAEQNLAKASFINKSNRINGYLEALNRWYVHLRVIDRHQCMKGLLKDLRDQVTNLYNEFFRVMTTVMDTLNNTFSENSRLLLAEGRKPSSSYTWQILTIEDVKDQLDEQIANLDANQELQKLVKVFFDNWKEWISQDENKITKLVSDFIADEFLTITNKNMIDYLKVKYKTTDEVTLTKAIKEDVIQGHLIEKAVPLFWRNGLFNLDSIAQMKTISVPFNASAIVDAANQVKAQGDTVRLTGLTDRIFTMRFYSGIPLYAYQGLAELEKSYEADTSVAGRHLYEAGDVDWREYLPSPYPDSFKMAGHAIPRIVERNKKLAEELEKAIKIGIIYSNTVGWHVKITKTPDVTSLLQSAGSYKTGNDVDLLKLTEVIESLESAKADMFSDNNVDQITLSTKGAKSGSEEIVLHDNYFRYPEVEKIVREQLAKVDALEAKIKELNDEYERESKKTGAQEDFFSAVFTGVIKLGRSMTTFPYEEFGMEQELELQNASMPYGKSAPLYQAFLTFKELDSDMSDMIREKASDAIDHMTDEIYAVAKEVQDRYSSDFLKMTLTRVAKDVNRKEIQAFYNDFMKALQEHIITYR